MELAARLARQGPVQALDCGNCFKAYSLARYLYLQNLPGKGPAVSNLLERVRVARAFTCYQVLTLLSETSGGEFPILALDLLATFYDENVPELERQRLLKTSLVHLQRLCQRAPVIVSIQPNLASAPGEPPALADPLFAAAGEVLALEAHPPRRSLPAGRTAARGAAQMPAQLALPV